MKKHFVFDENIIAFYEYDASDIGLYHYCESFRVKVNSIKYIAISPRMPFDDETCFLLIVDNQDRIYKMPEHVIYESDFVNLEKYFGLESLKIYNLKFKEIEFYQRLNKIIYPSKCYFEDLFVTSIFDKFLQYFTQMSNTFKGKIK